MICVRCLSRIRPLRRLPHSFSCCPPSLLLSRSAATSPSISPLTIATTAPRGPPSATHEGPPAATSASAAQPFSTPFTPHADAVSPKDSADDAQPKSSVPGGTVLKGLGFTKGKGDPVAKEDREYPDWLWSLLGMAEQGGKVGVKGEGGDEGNIYSKNKNKRRAAMRAARRNALHSGALVPQVPLEHQSIDLPSGEGRGLEGAREAQTAREELTDAMRRGRRKRIKEANFLKAMG